MNKISIGVITYQTKKGYEQMGYFEELAKVASSHKIPLFVFSVNDVDVKKGCIHGLWYASDKDLWERKWSDYPSIVYDHVRYHPTEQFKRYMKLRKSGLMTFSYTGYSQNKWKVAQYLAAFPDLFSYIPETNLIENTEVVDRFLQKEEAFIKPINGTGGKGIYLIRKNSDEYFIKGREEQEESMRKEELEKWVLRLIAKEPYIIQRRIPILYDGHPCDTRLLIQKNHQGKWTFTGMGTRIGKKNRIVSNLVQGADAMRTDLFIKQYLGKPAKSIIEEMVEVGLQIAERLDQKYGNFVELGLDIGITPDGTFQLIEVNPKPDRKIFIKTNQIEQFKQAILKPFAYHLYLCKQMETTSQ
jgi:glutathione synthase/RimK-type ligase-like ATP-grasp enzyme